MQLHEPDLWTHLVRYEIQPLRLVFRWIMRGFSGHLQVFPLSYHGIKSPNTTLKLKSLFQPDQLLYLWDLLLAYDSMEVFPLLASTVLRYQMAWHVTMAWE